MALNVTQKLILNMAYPQVDLPEQPVVNTSMLIPPLPAETARTMELEKSVGIDSIPFVAPIEDDLETPMLLKVGNDISTDDIMPAGARVMPWWSHIPRRRCQAASPRPRAIASAVPARRGLLPHEPKGWVAFTPST